MSSLKTWATRAALAVYCLWAALFILAKPGLQYDESLLVLGAVQMRHSPREIALPHDPDTWVCIHGRCFPLMTARYVGAVKEYLCLPLFALFGTSAAAVRCLSAFLGLLGIWGLARLVTIGINPAAGAVVAWLLVMNPSYLDLTVFDNGTVAIWMGVFGVLCAAIARYLHRRDWASGFLVGLLAGLGIWARANFLWLELAVLIAGLLVWRSVWLNPLKHWAAAMAGALIGGLPFLWYQIISRGGTWEAVSMFSSGSRPIYSRLIMLSETLLTDREHRAIWDGPAMPDWQRWLFPAIVLVACFFCRGKFARCGVFTLAILGGAFFSSRLPVAEHHLITLVPVAAVIVAGAAQRFRVAFGILGLLYFGCALFWMISAVQGIERTGGVGQWSNGIFKLDDLLEKRFAGRDIAILDWGLQNSIFVLSDGRVRSHEMYWGPAETPLFTEASWIPLLKQGGLFLINGWANRMMPDTTNQFLAQLDRQHPVVSRTVVAQQSGLPFAEMIEVKPDSVGQGEKDISFDISDARQLQGVYGLEQGRWRWTKRNFRIWLAGAGQRQLLLTIYLPKTSGTTLAVRLGDHPLCSQTFAQAGSYTVRCDVNPEWLNAAGQWFEFSLDKTIPGEPPDTRELGLIVSGAALTLR